MAKVKFVHRCDNGFGGHIWRIGAWFEAQRSGHGHIAYIRLWRLHWWGDPHRGGTVHWFWR
ncbi:hypothetical protein [Rhodoplanes serenus]|uniref:hypothetical protein n=1 Tax=Rhodoplanes serenus TaxID=200615 RepID=UPI0011B9462B|nr:hypothetical protein [Rhodoplanes serenus]